MELDPLVTFYLDSHPAAAANILRQLSIDDLSDFISIIPASSAAKVLPYLMPVVAAEVLTRLDIETGAEILIKMPNEAAVLIMRSMNRDLHRSYYQKMPRAAALRLRLQMRYPEALVGSMVESDVITLQPEQRVSDALRLIRTGKYRVSQQFYIVDNARRITGYVDLTALVSNRDRTPISRIKQKVPILLNTRTPFHAVEDLEAWLVFDSLPVVDRLGNFQGVLRREAISHNDHSMLLGISSEREFERTRGALSDIFWLATSSLLSNKSTLTTLRKKDE
jgi:Mg/Co/Ni transporter MgtE